MKLEEIDATGLIREAYRIDGITAPECRSIFVDWALKLPSSFAPQRAIQHLLEIYSPDAPDHPMTEVLRQGLETPDQPKRRGGRQARLDRD